MFFLQVECFDPSTGFWAELLHMFPEVFIQTKWKLAFELLVTLHHEIDNTPR